MSRCPGLDVRTALYNASTCDRPRTLAGATRSPGRRLKISCVRWTLLPRRCVYILSPVRLLFSEMHRIHGRRGSPPAHRRGRPLIPVPANGGPVPRICPRRSTRGTTASRPPPAGSHTPAGACWPQRGKVSAGKADRAVHSDAGAGNVRFANYEAGQLQHLGSSSRRRGDVVPLRGRRSI